jgi:hypothetical protein
MKTIQNILRLVFISSIALYTLEISAQFGFKQGYIITNTNDTLFCQIYDRGGIGNSKACVYRLDKDSKKTKFHANEIKAYRFLNDKYYEAIQINLKGKNKWVFAEVIIKGRISLYYYWRDKKVNYYIEKGDSILLGLSNDDIRAKVSDNSGTKVYWMTFKVFRDSLYSFFYDCKKIQDKVDFVDYNHESLTKISKEYISEKCINTSCINYEKDLNMNKPTFGVFSGIQLSKIDFLESKLDSKVVGIEVPIFYSVPIGVFYNFPLALLNDNLSFQIELITSSLNYSKLGDITKKNFITNIRSRTIGIPLLFKYVVSNSKYSPTIAFGKETGFNFDSKVTRTYTGAEYFQNDYLLSMHSLAFDNIDRTQNYTVNEYLHLFKSGGWFIEFGLNYKIKPKFSVFSNLRIQSTRNMIIYDKYYNRYTYNANVERNSYAEIYRTYLAALYFGLKF